jgi:hypothetical protein
MFLAKRIGQNPAQLPSGNHEELYQVIVLKEPQTGACRASTFGKSRREARDRQKTMWNSGREACAIGWSMRRSPVRQPDLAADALDIKENNG